MKLYKKIIITFVSLAVVVISMYMPSMISSVRNGIEMSISEKRDIPKIDLTSNSKLVLVQKLGIVNDNENLIEDDDVVLDEQMLMDLAFKEFSLILNYLGVSISNSVELESYYAFTIDKGNRNILKAVDVNLRLNDFEKVHITLDRESKRILRLSYLFSDLGNSYADREIPHFESEDILISLVCYYNEISDGGSFAYQNDNFSIFATDYNNLSYDHHFVYCSEVYDSGFYFNYNAKKNISYDPALYLPGSEAVDPAESVT